MGKIVAVANQKGGVGKTTTTVNLGCALAMQGKRVLLVDADPQGNCTSGLGVDRKKLTASLYNVLIEALPASEAVVSTGVAGLELLPTTIQLAGAEVEMAPMEDRELIMKAALSPLRADYDYVMIDCPPSLGLITVNALSAADSVLIPIQCEYYALDGLSQLMHSLNLLRRKLNPSLKVEGILMTMFDARTNLSLQVVEEVRKHFQREVYSTIIPRNVRLSEAPSFGQPIMIYDPKSRGSEVYQDLAREVMQRE